MPPLAGTTSSYRPVFFDQEENGRWSGTIAIPNSVLKKALGPVRPVTGGAGIEGGSTIVLARPGGAPRRPVCDRRCDDCDRLAARCWRVADLGISRCYLERAGLRVECPEHGAEAETVPWEADEAS